MVICVTVIRLSGVSIELCTKNEIAKKLQLRNSQNVGPVGGMSLLIWITVIFHYGI